MYLAMYGGSGGWWLQQHLLAEGRPYSHWHVITEVNGLQAAIGADAQRRVWYAKVWCRTQCMHAMWQAPGVVVIAVVLAY